MIGQCWCGRYQTEHTKHGDSEDCTYECIGNATQTCGGRDAMSVYEYTNLPYYYGCFADNITDRIMKKTLVDPLMTTQVTGVRAYISSPRSMTIGGLGMYLLRCCVCFRETGHTHVSPSTVVRHNGWDLRCSVPTWSRDKRVPFSWGFSLEIS